jgi:hypothetical protein
MIARLTAITDQNGLRVVSSLELAPGFMARQTSTGTSTIISILNMATTAQDHTPATDPKRASLSVRLPTSKETKCATDAVT